MRIFIDNRDHERFLEILGEVFPAQRVSCFAYCLMPNHYHVVIRTELPNLSRTFQRVNGRYARWWNMRHRRVGHVFQGRFDGRVIDADLYFIQACRYVAANPVEGGLVTHASHYRWSSFRATAGLATVPTFLDVKTILRHIGGPNPGRAYKQLIDTPASLAFLEELKSGRSVVGGPRFAARFRGAVEKAPCGLKSTDKRIGRPPLSSVLYGDPRRSHLARAIALAHDSLGYTAREISEFLDTSCSRTHGLLKEGRATRTPRRP